MIYVLNGGFRRRFAPINYSFFIDVRWFYFIDGLVVTAAASVSAIKIFPELASLARRQFRANDARVVFIAAWTFDDPGIHQRCAAQIPKIARNGILASVGFWLVFDYSNPADFMRGRCWTGRRFPSCRSQCWVTMLPPLLSGLFLTGLLATIVSTVDSFSLLSAITIERV
ncbi:MAG: hypothetical protein R3C26_14730 [Calditrichia bacterium]